MFLFLFFCFLLLFFLFLFLFFFCLFVFFFVFFFFAVNIAVSVGLLYIRMKVLELFPLESLSTILEYMFALQQQEKFPVEKFAHVTCMLDH